MRAERAFPGIDTPMRVAMTVGGAIVVDALVIWRFGTSAELGALLLFGTVSAVGAATDLASRKIPVAIILPAYPFAAVLLAVASADGGQWWRLARGGIGLVALSGFYLALGLAFPGQLGMGDIKLGGLIGLYLAWANWAALVTGTLLAWLLAALAIPAIHISTRGAAPKELPAGPFLVAGAIVVVLLNH